VLRLDPKGGAVRFMVVLAACVLILMYPYATGMMLPLSLTPGNWFWKGWW
jgi:hypothetical protein